MLSSKLQNFYILDTCHPTNPHPLGQKDPFHLLYDRGWCTIKWALWTCKKVVKVARQITNDHHPSHIFHGEQSVCVCVCVWAWHWNLTTTHHLFACNTTTQLPHLKDLPFTLCCSHCPPFRPGPFTITTTLIGRVLFYLPKWKTLKQYFSIPFSFLQKIYWLVYYNMNSKKLMISSHILLKHFIQLPLFLFFGK
jgi:hypothetical protein